MDNLNSPLPLLNGLTIPCIGYGTYQTPIDETRDVVAQAIDCGYRHIDTAAFYGNEEGVGQAIRSSSLPRSDFFVTTKLWNTERGYNKARAAFDASIDALGLDYVDLYLIHWPANYLQFGEEAKSINAQTWRALEDLYEEGRVKAIGVSNFLAHHLADLAETTRITPMVNQIEFHPGWNQRGVVRYCQDRGIVVEAWSPLGRKDVLDNEVLTAIGEAHSKSSAQVCMRWVLQHGVLPLPKTVSAERMAANADVFDFVLSKDEMSIIDELSNIGGQCARPDDVTF